MRFGTSCAVALLALLGCGSSDRSEASAEPDDAGRGKEAGASDGGRHPTVDGATAKDGASDARHSDAALDARSPDAAPGLDAATPPTIASAIVSTTPVGVALRTNFLGLSFDHNEASKYFGRDTGCGTTANLVACGPNPLFRQLLTNLVDANGGHKLRLRIEGDPMLDTDEIECNDAPSGVHWPSPSFTCATGSLNYPQAALLDPLYDLVTETSLADLFVGVDFATAQTCNGHVWGTGTPLPYCVAANEARNYAERFQSAPAGSIAGVEGGNEPDNYGNQGYRATGYGFEAGVPATDSWSQNFLDFTKATAALTSVPFRFVDPSTAGGSYAPRITGSAPPNQSTLTAAGLGFVSQHQYPYSNTWTCPERVLTSLVRTSGSVTVESASPTGYRTPIAVSGAVAAPGAVTASLAPLTTVTGAVVITQPSSTKQLPQAATVVIPVASTGALSVGQEIQLAGYATTAGGLEGQLLAIRSIEAGTSITASWPSYTVATSTVPSPGVSVFPALYGGSTVTVTGNANPSFDVVDARVTGVKTAPGMPAPTFTYVATPTGTSTGSSVATMTGGWANVTRTPIGAQGTSFEAVYDASRDPSLAGHYPYFDGDGYNPTFPSYAGYGYLAAVPFTAPDATHFVYAQEDEDDAVSSGTFTVVADSGPTPRHSPACNPVDLLLQPIAWQKSSLLYSGYFQAAKQASATAPPDIGMRETNFFSPAQVDISSGFQQALALLNYAPQLATFNIFSAGKTDSTWDGLDGMNFHGGEYTLYNLWEFALGSAPCASGTCTTYSLASDGAGVGVRPTYYAVLVLQSLLNDGASPLTVTTTKSANVQVWATLDAQASPHAHVLVVNASEVAAGDVVVTLPEFTSAKASLLTTSRPTGTTSITSFTVTGQTLTATVASTASLFEGRTGVFSGFTTDAWLNGLPFTIEAVPTSTSFTTTLPSIAGPTGPDHGVSVWQCTRARTFTCNQGITFGGQTFDGTPDGTLQGSSAVATLTPDAGTFTVAVPAVSAVLLDAQP